MITTAPIENLDLEEIDHGSFDSTAFAAQTLSDWQSLAAVIGHAFFNPAATRQQIENLCAEAIRYRVACVMVSPVWTSTVVAALAGTGIPAGAVIGFPFGASLVSTLRQEASALVRLGAQELGMVLPIGQLKSGDHHAVQQTIRAAVSIAHEYGVLLKVILEAGLLTVEEKLRASEVAIQAGADFIQTSTGFAAGGATPSDVALMRGVAGSRCGVTAAGGIRTLDDVQALLEAGANRIATSATVSILRELGAE